MNCKNINIVYNPVSSSIEIKLNIGRFLHKANTLIDHAPQGFNVTVPYVKKALAVCKKTLDNLPRNRLQTSLDRFYSTRFAPIAESKGIQSFNTWIDSNGAGSRIQKLSTYFLKLPLRAARNVLQTLYNIIKIALYTLVHPWDAMQKALQGIAQFVRSLSNPEVIAQMGAGTLGASLGQLIVTGASPHALLGLGTGAALLIGGLSFSYFKTAQSAEKGRRLEKIKAEWMKPVKQLPETLLTGLLTGLLVAGIQRAFQRSVWDKVTNETKARAYIQNEFLHKHHLTNPTEIQLDATGTITLTYKSTDVYRLLTANPKIAPMDYKWNVFNGYNPSVVHISIAHPEHAKEMFTRLIANPKPYFGYETGNVLIRGTRGYIIAHNWEPIPGFHYATKIAGPDLSPLGNGLGLQFDNKSDTCYSKL